MEQEVPVAIRHKVILFNVAQLYRENMTAEALYEATRGAWVIGPRREQAEYAMAVYHGVVQEVYQIECWYPGGTLEYRTRTLRHHQDQRRWEFSGHVANDIRAEYIGQYVGPGSQNPVHYVNI